MDPTIIFTSLIPLIIDGVKSIVGKYTGDKPAILSATDYSTVVDADIKKLQALASLDNPNGQTYTWVNSAKVLQRIVVVYATIGAWITATFFVSVPTDRYQLVSNLAGSIFFFLFGDRVNFYLKKN